MTHAKRPNEQFEASVRSDSPNGAALAAFLAAGIGASAIGVFVILNEAGLFTAPTLYGPAGGVSGRTSFAAAVWLIAWGILHRRWAPRQVDGRGAWGLTLVLIALGVIATLPPLWELL
jgi:hypothetical protein